MATAAESFREEFEEAGAEHGAANRIKDNVDKLNTAARIKQTEISSGIHSRYANIKRKLTQAKNSGMNKLEQAKQKTADAIHTGNRKVRQTAYKANRTVHENPWPMIGGAAAAGLLFGFLIRSLRKKTPNRVPETGGKTVDVVPVPRSRALTKETRIQAPARYASTMERGGA